VLVTHVHPDHHGLSGAVRERSGAWIAMHEREDAQLARFTQPGRRAATADYLRWCGAPDEHIGQLAAGSRLGATAAMARGAMARADRLLAHGDLVDVPGLRLRAVWTPGHLCFYDETRDLLLTGDHVLPRITPNISSYERTSTALSDYLQSLESLRGIEPAEVLPAHEYRFAGLDDRLTHLQEHHHERLAEILAVLKPGDSQSAWEIASQVTWSRPWSQISGFPRQAAIGEVVAHLQLLATRGDAVLADVDGVGRWTLVPARPDPDLEGLPPTEPAEDDPVAGDPAVRF
jgi:glyoxylase-like metal-dependent hydrolase (beta-lactamase superfamily II)